MNRPARRGILLFGVVIGASAIGYAFYVFIFASSLKPGQEITLFTWSTSRPTPQPKSLPSGKGDHLLIGEVRKNGRVVPHASFVFLFQDMFRSEQIKTDSGGRFEYRLPPGQWKFLGPLMIGSNENMVTYIFVNPPIANASPTFDVGSGLDTKTIQITIINGRAGSSDL